MMPDTDTVQPPRRSLLFTPANRPAAFAKALASGADIACIDLEDAVPQAAKDASRPDGVGFLSAADPAHPVQRALRINALGTAMGLRDMVAVIGAAPQHGLLMLPKTEAARDLFLADRLLAEAGSGLGLAAIIESLEGLEAVAEIAAATPRLRLLIFGAIDLSAEMGIAPTPAAMAYARGKIVAAGRRAGVDVMDVPSLDVHNLDAVRDAANVARDLGFTGKAAIHPAAVAVINAAFTPGADEIVEAQEIIALYEAAPSGLALRGGHLIEAPVVKAMRKRLAMAARAGQGT